MNHVLTERIPATLEGFAEVFQVTLGEKTTHSHGYFFGSLCADGEKGESTLGKVGRQVPEPVPVTQGLGTLDGGPGAANAVAGTKLILGRLSKTGSCSSSIRKTSWERR